MSLSREVDVQFRNVLNSCSIAEPGLLYTATERFQSVNHSLHGDQNLLLQLAWAFVCFLSVFQLQFALVQHGAQHFVGNMIFNSSNAEALPSAIIFSSGAGIFDSPPVPVPRFNIPAVLDTEADLKLEIYSRFLWNRHVPLFLDVFWIEVLIMWKLLRRLRYACFNGLIFCNILSAC